MQAQKEVIEHREITIKGSTYERGLEYGRGCKEAILSSIESFKTLFADRKQITWDRACRIAKDYIPGIKAFNANYLEEMQGIADGAEVMLEEIVALNSRSEIMFANQIDTADRFEEEGQGCTAFSLTDSAAKDGHTMAGQTWDFSCMLRKSMVTVHVCQSERPSFVMVCEAGMIGGIGMNDAGIGLTLNALRATEPCTGIPLRVRMRAILDSRFLSEAYVNGAHRPLSVANLIITHKDGAAIGLEMDAKQVDVLIPEDGVLVHTNHFIGYRMKLLHDNAGTGSTYIRLQRMTQLIKARGAIGVDDLMDILKDHVGYPTSICSHPNPYDPPIKHNATNFAVIMDLSEGCMYLALGNPCESEFKRILV